MKRLLLALVMVLGASGCSLKTAKIPQADIPFAKADYRVLGETNHQECGTYVIGLDFAHLFKNEAASPSGGAAGLLPIPGFVLDMMPSPLGKEGGRALYYALEKMPEATHLLAPRVHTTTEGIGLGPWLLFGKRCASVTAHGVKMGTGPTQNQ